MRADGRVRRRLAAGRGPPPVYVGAPGKRAVSGRPHHRPVHGQHRRGGPSLEGQRGKPDRLGDGRVQHAARQHVTAEKAGAGPNRRAQPGNPAARRTQPAGRGRRGGAWAAHRSPSIATCWKPTAERARPASPAASWRLVDAIDSIREKLPVRPTRRSSTAWPR